MWWIAPWAGLGIAVVYIVYALRRDWRTPDPDTNPDA